jgi:hypothetical protein
LFDPFCIIQSLGIMALFQFYHRIIIILKTSIKTLRLNHYKQVFT